MAQSAAMTRMGGRRAGTAVRSGRPAAPWSSALAGAAVSFTLSTAGTSRPAARRAG